ncbi:MAG: hypothetical protein AAF138_01130 [Planctomycetota bacterium]
MTRLGTTNALSIDLQRTLSQLATARLQRGGGLPERRDALLPPVNLPTQPAASNRELDGLANQVRSIANAARLGSLPQAENLVPTVGSVNVRRFDLDLPGPRPFEADIIQQAERGSVELAFSDAQPRGLDLNSGSQLVFEIETSTGARQFAFASGTSFQGITAAINAFQPLLGVKAETVIDDSAGAGGRVIISSMTASDDAFVGVRVINDGGLFDTPEPGVEAIVQRPGKDERESRSLVDGQVVDRGRDLLAVIQGRTFRSRAVESDRVLLEFISPTVEIDIVFDITGGRTTVSDGALFDLVPPPRPLPVLSERPGDAAEVGRRRFDGYA